MTQQGEEPQTVQTSPPNVVAKELVEWAHHTLEQLFDFAFLRNQIRAECVRGRFCDERDAQQAVLKAIKQLKPPVTVSARSPAWRIYTVLNLRYEQGLSQAEAASQMHISTRYLRSIQQEAIGAVAALLFDRPVNHAHSVAPVTLDQGPIQLDELLATSSNVLAPLLQQRQLRLELNAPEHPTLIWASRMLVRQLVMSALGWLVSGVSDQTLHIQIESSGQQSVLRMQKGALDDDEVEGSEALETINELACELKAQVTLSGSPPSLQIALPSHKARRVLLVDDDPAAVELVRRYLQQNNEFELFAIPQPEDLVQQVTAIQPACILLDLMMPTRDGWEILSLLKAFPQTATIPIIVISVLKESQLSRALGAAGTLRKPFNSTQLIAAIQSATGKGTGTPASSIGP